MKTLILLICLFLISISALSQTPDSPSAREMKKLDFLLGNWKGEGWIEMGPRGRSTFQQTEIVEGKLNGTIMVVEGIGKGKFAGSNEEGVVHHAVAVISYDQAAKKYLLRAFRADGNFVDADVTTDGNSLIWVFRDPQRNTEIKYTIKLTSDGKWLEIGEFSMDGKTWRKFFEMSLQRVK